MKKKVVGLLLAVSVFVSAIGAVAVEINSYSERLTVYYDGVNVYENSVNQPCIINDRTMVPLRPIFEAMGWGEENISFDEATATAVFSMNGISCAFINENHVAVKTQDDGTQAEYELDVPAVIHNGNFYIPLRAFCNIWGVEITWNDASRSVYITKTMMEDNSDSVPEAEEDNTVVEETPSEAEDVVIEEKPEKTTISQADAVAQVQELVGDDYTTSPEYSFEYNGKTYYQIAVNAKIVDEFTGEQWTSKVSNYIISADGEEVFEGYYNQETGVLSNYEEETMEQE